AEDNPINQKVALRMLQNAGHAVTVVNNGKEAVSAATEGHFDVLIMDVQMPEMDGLQATGLLRQREQATGEHLPIIAMTAHAMKGDRECCLAAGMDGYVSKPIHLAELRQAILSVLPSDASASPSASRTELHGGEPVARSDDREVFELSTALAQMGDSVDFLIELATMLAEDAPAMLADIRRAIEEQDAERLEKTAHRLKGSVAPFAASAAMAAAERLEIAGRRKDLSTTKQLGDRLQEEISRLLTALAALSPTGKPSEENPPTDPRSSQADVPTNTTSETA
ncbi:MAG: response regulator, partial [Pirellulales bacterium]|nr:response regulator [Pirellulales bacterium]